MLARRFGGFFAYKTIKRIADTDVVPKSGRINVSCVFIAGIVWFTGCPGTERQWIPVGPNVFAFCYHVVEPNQGGFCRGRAPRVDLVCDKTVFGCRFDGDQMTTPCLAFRFRGVEIHNLGMDQHVATWPRKDPVIAGKNTLVGGAGVLIVAAHGSPLAVAGLAFVVGGATIGVITNVGSTKAGGSTLVLRPAGTKSVPRGTATEPVGAANTGLAC